MPFPTPDNGVRALSGFPTKLTIVRRDPYCNVEKWFRHRSTLKRESRPRYVCVSAQSRGSTGTESSVLYSVAAHIIAELSVTSWPWPLTFIASCFGNSATSVGQIFTFYNNRRSFIMQAQRGVFLCLANDGWWCQCEEDRNCIGRLENTIWTVTSSHYLREDGSKRPEVHKLTLSVETTWLRIGHSGGF